MNAKILYILGYKVDLVGRTYETSLDSEDHDFDTQHDLKECPGWIDSGTRGCPIPNGAVLAGASKRSNAMWLAIIDLRYKHKTIKLRLPFPVESLCMVYDDDTEVLTIAGGTGFGDEERALGKQIWQIKLFDKGSEWHQMLSLQQGVYDPVLFSNRGVIFIVGGYNEPKHVDATTRCLKLPIGGGWQDIGNLPEPLKDPGHREGVLWTDTNPAGREMIVITDDEALHCDSTEDEWVRHDHGKNLKNCTPVLGSDGNVYVHLKYIDDGKEKYDVGAYDPKSHELVYLKDEDFMSFLHHVFIPGYFLAPIL